MADASFVTPDASSPGVSGSAKLQSSAAATTAIKRSAPSSSSPRLKKTKTPWTAAEDELLERLIGQYGPKQWPVVASMLSDRTSKQARERWCNHLAPGLKRGPWMEDEENLLLALHSEWGNQWCEITKRIEGRTANGIKNHWNCATTRRRLKLPTKSRLKETGGDEHTPRRSNLELVLKKVPKRKRLMSFADEDSDSSNCSDGGTPGSERPSLGAAVSEEAVASHTTRTGRTVRRTAAARWNDANQRKRINITSTAVAQRIAKRSSAGMGAEQALARLNEGWSWLASDVLELWSATEKEHRIQQQQPSLDESDFAYDFATDTEATDWCSGDASTAVVQQHAETKEGEVCGLVGHCEDSSALGLTALMHPSGIAAMSIDALEWTDLSIPSPRPAPLDEETAAPETSPVHDAARAVTAEPPAASGTMLPVPQMVAEQQAAEQQAAEQQAAEQQAAEQQAVIRVENAKAFVKKIAKPAELSVAPEQLLQALRLPGLAESSILSETKESTVDFAAASVESMQTVVGSAAMHMHALDMHALEEPHKEERGMGRDAQPVQ